MNNMSPWLFFWLWWHFSGFLSFIRATFQKLINNTSSIFFSIFFDLWSLDFVKTTTFSTIIFFKFSMLMLMLILMSFSFSNAIYAVKFISFFILFCYFAVKIDFIFIMMLNCDSTFFLILILWFFFERLISFLMFW